MKVELTDRDKRTLTILGVFVIVVCIGYWGVFGQIKKANDYKDEIEEQQTLQTVYETKVGQLPVVEVNNENLEKLIEGAKENYYPIMTNEEVDKLVTNMVIEDYGIFAYDLSITDAQLASLAPYQYSNKAITGYSEAKMNAMQAAAPIVSDDGMILFSDEFGSEEGSSMESESESMSEDFYDFDIPTTGIMVSTVTMRLGGELEQFQKFLDDLATTNKKLRLVDYSVQTVVEQIKHETNVVEDESSENVIAENNVDFQTSYVDKDGNLIEELTFNYLDVTFELYMCQE